MKYIHIFNELQFIFLKLLRECTTLIINKIHAIFMKSKETFHVIHFYVKQCRNMYYIRTYFKIENMSLHYKFIECFLTFISVLCE